LFFPRTYHKLIQIINLSVFISFKVQKIILIGEGMKKVDSIVIEAVIELNEELECETLENPTNKTKLFGGNGALNSLALVSLISDLEDRISEEFDKDIVLADEKAMSQRASPFRTVAALTDYIEKLLSE
jgi:acyl carrier protein